MEILSKDRLTDENLTYTPEDKPYGITWEEWTAKWWQWVLSIPKDNNPITDSTGRSANYGQSGPVWFLAGTFGGRHERTCEIPAEKAILFPISTNATCFAEMPNYKTEEELRAFAKADIDNVKTLITTVDGTKIDPSSLKSWRIQSPKFEVKLPDDNILGTPSGPTEAVSDGYWVFLRPLKEGPHQIHFLSSCRIGTQWIEADYHLHAK